MVERPLTSSARTMLVRVTPALDRYGDFATFRGDAADPAWHALRRAETTGRPLGAADWLADIERRTGRTLAAQKRGPQGKAN
jgi:putative transposase